MYFPAVCSMKLILGTTVSTLMRRERFELPTYAIIIIDIIINIIINILIDIIINIIINIITNILIDTLKLS